MKTNELPKKVQEDLTRLIHCPDDILQIIFGCIKLADSWPEAQGAIGTALQSRIDEYRHAQVVFCDYPDVAAAQPGSN